MNNTTPTDDSAKMREVNLSWDPNPESDKVTSYQLYRQTADGWVNLAESEGLEATVQLPVGASVVAVAAKNGQGFTGPKSVPLEVLAEPSAPVGLRVRIIIDLQINAG
jgi:hypothetical protein